LTTLSAVEWLAAGGTDGNNYILFIFLAGMIAVMWFMNRRNRKSQQAAADFRDNLQIGDRVRTTAGMIAVISGVEGDIITLRSQSGSESQYLRRVIATLVPDDEWEALLMPPALDAEDEDFEDSGLPDGDFEDLEDFEDDDADTDDQDADADDADADDTTNEEDGKRRR
jgi:preprotein translocase YajC subunit